MIKNSRNDSIEGGGSGKLGSRPCLNALTTKVSMVYGVSLCLNKENVCISSE